MAVQSNAISPQQMRCIYALARSGGLDHDSLHAIVEAETGAASIKDLTKWDAKRVIESIKRLTGQETVSPPGRITRDQIRMIYGLASSLGWGEDPSRLRGWLEKKYGVSHPNFLLEGPAKNCIEAMKAMLSGGRGERRRRDG